MSKLTPEEPLERSLLKMKAMGVTMTTRARPGSIFAQIQAEADRLGMGSEADAAAAEKDSSLTRATCRSGDHDWAGNETDGYYCFCGTKRGPIPPAVVAVEQEITK